MDQALAVDKLVRILAKRAARDRPGAAQPSREVEKTLPEIPHVPATEDIEKMTAEAYGNPRLSMPDVPSFEVPRKNYDAILTFFHELTKIDDKASQVADLELGTIHMTLPDKRSLRVCWFDTGGKTRLSFSANGVRFLTTGAKFTEDHALALDALIRAIYQRTRQGATPAVKPGSGPKPKAAT
jgi:hypothetical protein